MNNFFSLVKVEFLSQFGLNKILHSKKDKRLSGMSGLCIFAVLMVALIGYIGYTYADMYALLLVATGRIEELLPLMIAISCLLSFALSFYTSSNVLYGYKDYDLLMSMPIKQSAIVISKLVFIYLFDLVFAIIVAVASFIVYAGYTALTVGLVLRVIAMVIFAPLLPIALSLFLGAFISYVSSRFRKKNVAQIIMYIIIFIVCFGAGFLQGVEIFDPTKMLGKIYFLMPWAIKSITEIPYLLLFIGVNLVSFLVVAVVCAVTYKKMNSLITAKKRAKDFKLKNYGGKTKSRALLSRELTRFFSVAIYTMNALVGPILGVVGTIALAVVARNQMGGYIAELMVFLPIILAFTFMMAPPTNCSISLEGKSYWIIKTLPISAKDLINAKLMVNNIFGVLPAFITGLVATIIFGAPYYEVILITALAVGIALLGGGIGLLANLLFPLLNWENPNKPVKQSLAVFITIISAMAFAGGFFAISYFASIKTIYQLLIFFGIVVISNLVVYGIIRYKGEKLLSKI